MALASTSAHPPGSTGTQRWTCQKLGKASAAVQNKIFGFYTPSHWVAFLRTFDARGRLCR